MESSIAEFLMWQAACEHLPTLLRFSLWVLILLGLTMPPEIPCGELAEERAAYGHTAATPGPNNRLPPCWAEARIKIARMTLTIKLDGNWSSFQLANSTPPLGVTGSAIAPSARMVGKGPQRPQLPKLLTDKGLRLCGVICGKSPSAKGGTGSKLDTAMPTLMLGLKPRKN